jgi:hypothetical protein
MTDQHEANCLFACSVHTEGLTGHDMRRLVSGAHSGRLGWVGTGFVRRSCAEESEAGHCFDRNFAEALRDEEPGDAIYGLTICGICDAKRLALKAVHTKGASADNSLQGSLAEMVIMRWRRC